jgi:hypothetical protein
MKKLIVVEGIKSSGKTTIIREAATLLGCGILQNAPADIFIITYLRLGRSKYGVGIASSGDTAKIIKSNIDALYDHHLDYVITACSAPNAGMAILKAYAEIEGAEMVRVSSDWKQNLTTQQIAAKVTRIAREVRSHIP